MEFDHIDDITRCVQGGILGFERRYLHCHLCMRRRTRFARGANTAEEGAYTYDVRRGGSSNTLNCEKAVKILQAERGVKILKFAEFIHGWPLICSAFLLRMNLFPNCLDRRTKKREMEEESRGRTEANFSVPGLTHPLGLKN